MFKFYQDKNIGSSDSPLLDRLGKILLDIIGLCSVIFPRYEFELRLLINEDSFSFRIPEKS